jgi:hypothetical protein
MAEGSRRAAARTGHRQAAEAIVHMITAAAGGAAGTATSPSDVRP